MKTLTKRVLSLALAACMTGSGAAALTGHSADALFPVVARAEDTSAEAEFTYTVENGEATITGTENENIKNLVIPSEIDGYKVTAIGSYAFECSNLKTIVLPDSITEIGYDAFYGCSSLESVNIPNGVTTIGFSAFEDCSNLKTIVLPDSITEIESSMFSGCSSLETVSIPNGVTTIGSCAFENCTSISEITIPQSVSEIGQAAFTNTPYYNDPNNWENELLYIENFLVASSDQISGNVSIKPGTKVIASGIFTDQTNIKSVKIPESVSKIPTSCFSRCTGLVSVDIPSCVTEIGAYAFVDCSNLTSVVIPSGISEIPYLCFSGCTSLQTVSVPESVEEVGLGAFSDTAIFNNENNWDDGILYIDNCLVGVKQLSGDVSIKPGTRVIADEVFEFHYEITSVSIPNSVKTIGTAAFYSCTNLENVSLPDRLKKIGNMAFDGTPFFDSQWDGVALYYNGYLLQVSPDLSGTYSVKNGTKLIANMAFDVVDCEDPIFDKLTEIIIPDSVEIIGDYAFRGCSKPLKITIPASVTHIGRAVFCKNGRDVVIHGYSGSYAQKYAKAHNIAFVELPGTPDLPPDKPSVEEPVIGKIEGAKTVTSGGVEVLAALDGVTVATVRKAAKNAKLLDKNGNAVSDTARLATGMKLVFDNKTVTIAVLGDVDGNGVIGVADARLALRAAVSLEKLGGVYLLAAEVGNNSVGVSQAREILRVAVGLDDGKSWLK